MIILLLLIVRQDEHVTMVTDRTGQNFFRIVFLSWFYLIISFFPLIFLVFRIILMVVLNQLEIMIAL